MVDTLFKCHNPESFMLAESWKLVAQLEELAHVHCLWSRENDYYPLKKDMSLRPRLDEDACK